MSAPKTDEMTNGARARCRRRLITVSSLSILVALAVALRDAPGRLLVVEDKPQAVDVAIVLAGDPDYERTSAAARMVLSGQAKWLVVTGGETGPGDSASSLRAKAVGLGVASEVILSEERSHGTWDSLVNVGPLLDSVGAKSVAVVTSPYHQRRATAVARKLWPARRVVAQPAKPSFWSPEGWWRTRRGRGVVVDEWAKLLGYAALGRL